MNNRLLLSPRHRRILAALLREYLPDVEVWAYGNRVNGQGHEGSDLALVLRGPGLREIPLDQLVDFEDAVRESNIPFLVDSRDWARLPERFHREIEGGYVVVEGTPSDSCRGWYEGTYGSMRADRVERSLRTLCTHAHGIQTGPFGSQLHKKDYVLDGTPIVTVEHLGDNRLVHKNLPRVSDADRERLSKYDLRAGDIVFSRVGSVDRRALVRQEEEGWLFSGRCLRIRSAPDQINPVFLSYFFGWSTFREHIKSIAVGATMPSLNTKILSDIIVSCPPLPEQRAIAHILGTLDDKIELNRRMNDTLEAMARALFKSWFIDFDPVRAKMEGRDTGLPDHLADLFPERLVQSELGFIPEGWLVTALGNLIELAYGKSLPHRNRRPGSVPVYGSNGQVGWHDEPLVDGPGIIVGRKGNPGAVKWSQTAFFPIDTTFYVVPKDIRHGLFFLFHLLRTQDLPSISSDSAVPGMNRHIAYMNRATVPPADVVEAFCAKVKTVSGRQDNLMNELHTLISIRDTLLPKLISGEIWAPSALSLT